MAILMLRLALIMVKNDASVGRLRPGVRPGHSFNNRWDYIRRRRAGDVGWRVRGPGITTPAKEAPKGTQVSPFS